MRPRVAPMPGWRHWVAALVAVLAVALIGACSRPERQDGLRFPAPDRPVARIVSPTYSDEATRDARARRTA
jgi:hypothetical protein